MRVCQAVGCENRLKGGARKWCSERCRCSQYGGVCEVCGKATSGRNGSEKATSICATCFRERQHTQAKERHVAAVQRFAQRYGRPPAATDWNPHHAIAMGQPERAERCRRDGDYPKIGAIQRTWGSWANLIEAAGFTPYKPGHYGRSGEDPEVVAETVQLYGEGLTLAEVGERLGVSDTTVVYRLKCAGVERRPKAPRGHPVELRRRGVDLYAAGVPSTVIADALGVSHSAVLKWARAAGVPIRPRGRKPQERLP